MKIFSHNVEGNMMPKLLVNNNMDRYLGCKFIDNNKMYNVDFDKIYYTYFESENQWAEVKVKSIICSHPYFIYELETPKGDKWVDSKHLDLYADKNSVMAKIKGEVSKAHLVEKVAFSELLDGNCGNANYRVDKCLGYVYFWGYHMSNGVVCKKDIVTKCAWWDRSGFHFILTSSEDFYFSKDECLENDMPQILSFNDNTEKKIAKEKLTITITIEA